MLGVGARTPVRNKFRATLNLPPSAEGLSSSWLTEPTQGDLTFRAGVSIAVCVGVCVGVFALSTANLNFIPGTQYVCFVPRELPE